MTYAQQYLSRGLGMQWELDTLPSFTSHLVSCYPATLREESSGGGGGGGGEGGGGEREDSDGVRGSEGIRDVKGVSGGRLANAPKDG